MVTGASAATTAEEFPAREVYAAMQARGETIAPETVARFCRFLLLEASCEELGRGIWDIRDPSHHPRWLTGPLYAAR